MAIKIFEKYTPRANTPTVDYPVGSIKNESVPGANDGTPLDKDWGNDYAGFDAALFAMTNIEPDGNPDTAVASQRLEALLSLQGDFADVDNMIAGTIGIETITHRVGNRYCTGYGFWIVSSVSGLPISGGLFAQPLGPIYGRDFGQVSDGVTDDKPALDYLFSTADSLNAKAIVNKGDSFIDTVQTSVTHGGVTHNIPVGFAFDGMNFDIEFEEGARFIIGDQGVKPQSQQGRYYIIFVKNGEVNLIKPSVVGDKEITTQTQGEFGYGIFYADGATGVIHNPTSINMWGDGIAWGSEENGFITGISKTENNRRQGISIFNCGYLYIEHNKSKDIDGAPAGPWAAIDAEPNSESEGIRNLVIGRIDAENCRGGSFLTFLGRQDGTSDPFNIEIGTASSKGCAKGATFTVPKRFTKGAVVVDKIISYGDDANSVEVPGFVNSASLKINSITSINTNPTSNPDAFYAPVVITNQATSEVFADTGNIKIGSLDIVNDTNRLPCPVSIFDQGGTGGFGDIYIDKISYRKDNMIREGLINTAQARLFTDSLVTNNFASSGSLDWDEWANHITNDGASTNVVATAVSDYGFSGMELRMESVEPGREFTFVHTPDKIGPYSEMKAFSEGGVTVLVNLGVGDYWYSRASTYGIFGPGGKGSYVPSVNIGGPTSARPVDPQLWQRYFDVNLSKDIIWDGSAWISAADGSPT